MNNDPKYWAEDVLPWIQELKAKHEKAGQLLQQLEDVAKSKAGYVKVAGIWYTEAPNFTVNEWIKIHRTRKEN